MIRIQLEEVKDFSEKQQQLLQIFSNGKDKCNKHINYLNSRILLSLLYHSNVDWYINKKRKFIIYNTQTKEKIQQLNSEQWSKIFKDYKIFYNDLSNLIFLMNQAIIFQPIIFQLLNNLKIKFKKIQRQPDFIDHVLSQIELKKMFNL